MPRGVPPALSGVDGEHLGELIAVIQQLSLARHAAEVQDIVKHAARRLADADGASFVLRDGDLCWYVDEDAVSPLWKGRRFPMDICISGWAMRHRQAVAIPDVYADERVPHDAYRPTFVRSLLMTPIRISDPLGAIGVYWAAEREVGEADRHLLQALADTTAVALESVRVWEELERRVADRTAELAAINGRLAAEIVERQRAEAEVRALSVTDELTGLRNRRGFLFQVGQALGSEPRGDRSLLVFADVDGLKAVNDTLGHARGDELLTAAAEVLRRCFRESDVLARVGGDEFAVFVPHTFEPPPSVVDRLDAEVLAANAAGTLPAPLSLSVGVTAVGVDSRLSLDVLLDRADRAMYRQKRRKWSRGVAG